MIVSVYDLLGKATYTEFDVAKDLGCLPQEVFAMPLAKLLVVPNGETTNRGPYLLSKDHLLINDLVEKATIHTRNLSSITKILLGLQYQLLEEGTKFRLAPAAQGSKQTDIYSERLKQYFAEHQRGISIRKKQSNISTEPAMTILCIPDWVDESNQDIILDAARSVFASPLLIWNSVAACIGVIQELQTANLSDGSTVLVHDENSALQTSAILKMHAHEKRLIPGHHIYWDSENPQERRRRREYYPRESYAEHYDGFAGEFACTYKDGYVQLLPPANPPAFVKTKVPENLQPDAQIFLQNNRSFISLPGQPQMEKNAVALGAALFAQQKEAGLTPYFEECKALYMVTITSQEEVQLKSLIEYTEKLPAGKALQQKVIYDVSLQKGADSVEFYLLFSTETQMDTLKKMPLRSLKQTLHVSDALLNAPREVPLILVPTVYAGQGRARVEVRQSTDIQEDVLSPVFLDWNEMKLTRKTANQLEEKLLRSFPVDIPTVICDQEKFNSARMQISSYVYGESNIARLDLAKSTFIDRQAPGLEKLRRSSIFGSPKNKEKDLPFSLRDRELAERLFQKLKQAYQSEGDPQILTQIAWTYHGEYFKQITKAILGEIEAAAPARASITTQKFTCCANLLTDDQDMIRYMKAFIVRLRDPEKAKISNWCRAAYQVLMYNSSFLRPDLKNPLSLEDLNECIRSLILAYYKNSDSKIICGNIDKTIYFLFKARKYHKAFCKAEQSTDAHSKNYEAIKAVLLCPKAAFAKIFIDLQRSYQAEPTLYTKTPEYSYLRALKVQEQSLGKALRVLQVPSEEEWSAFNDWNLWEAKEELYWTRLAAYPTFGLPKVKKHTCIDYLRFYEAWLVAYYEKNNLRNLHWYSLSSERADKTWRVDIAKMLIGRGNLNLPLGEND